MAFRRKLLGAAALVAGAASTAQAGCLLLGGLGMSYSSSGYGGYGGYSGSGAGPYQAPYQYQSYQYQSTPLLSTQLAPMATTPLYSAAYTPTVAMSAMSVPTVAMPTVAVSAAAPLTSYRAMSLAPAAASQSVSPSQILVVPATLGAQSASSAANAPAQSARLVVASVNGESGFGDEAADCNTYQAASVVSTIREAIDLIKVIRDVLGDGTTPSPGTDFESRLRDVEDDVDELQRRFDNKFGPTSDQSSDDADYPGHGLSPFSRPADNVTEEEALRQMMDTMEKLAEVPDHLTRISSEVESLKAEVDRLSKRIDALEGNQPAK